MKYLFLVSGFLLIARPWFVVSRGGHEESTVERRLREAKEAKQEKHPPRHASGTTADTADTRSVFDPSDNAKCEELRIDLIKSNSIAKVAIEVGSMIGLWRAGASALIKDGTLVLDGLMQHQATAMAAAVGSNRIRKELNGIVFDAHALMDQMAALAVATCEMLDSIDKPLENYERTARAVMSTAGINVGQEMSKILSEVLANEALLEREMIYPNYEIDLCQEDCSQLCRADYFEIGWLDNPDAASIKGIHNTLVRLVYPGSDFADDFIRNYYGSLYGEMFTPAGQEQVRLDELINFAQNVESWCTGRCSNEQTQQFNNLCCDYPTCTTSEQEALGFCAWWAGSSGVLHEVSIGPNQQCLIQGASSQDYENYSGNGNDQQCFLNDVQADCTVERGDYVAVDGAEYCGGEWTDLDFFCLVGPVGYRATIHQNVCTREGLQATNRRFGSYCQVMAINDCIVNMDEDLMERCPGRFTPMERPPF